jgi:hypothetical protein
MITITSSRNGTSLRTTFCSLSEMQPKKKKLSVARQEVKKKKNPFPHY